MFAHTLRSSFTALLGLALVVPAFSQEQETDPNLVPFYKAPAPRADVQPTPRKDPKKVWADHKSAIPIGNGRLGALLYGGTQYDRIIVNEDSMWRGYPVTEEQDREGAFKALQQGRAILREGKYEQGANFLVQNFLTPYGFGTESFGSFTSFFHMDLEFEGLAKTSLADPEHPHNRRVVLPENVSNYRRELNMQRAISKVSFEENGVKHEREYFSSHPAETLVARYRSQEPMTVRLKLGSDHKEHKVAVTPQGLLAIVGEVSQKNGPGMKFEGRVQIELMDGAFEVEGEELIIRNSRGFVAYITGNTNYKLDYPTYVHELTPAQRNDAHDALRKGKTYEQLREEHVKDFRSLFDRVTLRLGGGEDRTAMSAGERDELYGKEFGGLNRDITSTKDRGYETMVFHFARYLMISGSRPNGQPLNLQGMWTAIINPPWQGDYHLNINFQMNYWMADKVNLPECQEPMFAWFEDMIPSAQKTAQVHYNSPGWVMHHTCNAWGFAGPGAPRGKHMMESEAGSWMARHFWERYAYTGDEQFLRERAWPVLKGSVEFWMHEGNTEKNAQGERFVNPSYSPEHGYLTDKAFLQPMVLHDLFTNSIQAAKIVGEDPAFIAKMEQFLSELPSPKIGNHGQLMEWNSHELEEENIEKKPDRPEIPRYKTKHRHISHLYAVYPAAQITPEGTPELAEAAYTTMKLRGAGGTGWSGGWKSCVWARMGDPDLAYLQVARLANSMTPNLLGRHPPFQIDANFGYGAAVCELLVQSHQGFIELLPTLPKAWEEGEFSGLRARGGFDVSAQWKDGKLVVVKITSLLGNPLKLKYGETKREVPLKKGETLVLGADLQPL